MPHLRHATIAAAATICERPATASKCPTFRQVISGALPRSNSFGALKDAAYRVILVPAVRLFVLRRGRAGRVTDEPRRCAVRMCAWAHPSRRRLKAVEQPKHLLYMHTNAHLGCTTDELSTAGRKKAERDSRDQQRRLVHQEGLRNRLFQPYLFSPPA